MLPLRFLRNSGSESNYFQQFSLSRVFMIAKWREFQWWLHRAMVSLPFCAQMSVKLWILSRKMRSINHIASLLTPSAVFSICFIAHFSLTLSGVSFESNYINARFENKLLIYFPFFWVGNYRAYRTENATCTNGIFEFCISYSRVSLHQRIHTLTFIPL